MSEFCGKVKPVLGEPQPCSVVAVPFLTGCGPRLMCPLCVLKTLLASGANAGHTPMNQKCSNVQFPLVRQIHASLMAEFSTPIETTARAS